jgi:hypothetical protein
MSFQVMAWAIEQKPSDSESKLLLLLLANYASHENTCWPSVSTLSKESLLSETTVRDRLRVLAGLNLIAIQERRTPNGDLTSNLYTLLAGGPHTRPPTSPGDAPPFAGRTTPPRGANHPPSLSALHQAKPQPQAGASPIPNQSVEPITDPEGKEATPIKVEHREEIEKMHACFLLESQQDANLMAYGREWLALCKSGYTAEDVSIFLKHVKFVNSQQEDPKFRRRFHIPKMFGDIACFDADLGLAKAWYRNRRLPPTAREQALEDLRPSVDPELDPARLRPPQRAEDLTQEVINKLINAEKERLRREGIRTV